FTSTAQTLPSLSTRIPCDEIKLFSPQACSIFPFLSNWTTGCEPRLNTQTLSWRSTATPEHSPKFQPFGSCAQSLTTLCGNAGPVFNSADSGVTVTNAESSKRYLIAPVLYYGTTCVREWTITWAGVPASCRRRSSEYETSYELPIPGLRIERRRIDVPQ